MIITLLLFFLSRVRWVYYIQNQSLTKIIPPRIVTGYGAVLVATQFFYKLKFVTTLFFFTTDPNYFFFAKFNVFVYRFIIFCGFWRRVEGLPRAHQRRTKKEQTYRAFVRTTFFTTFVRGYFIIDEDFSKNFNFNVNENYNQSWDFSVYFENFLGLWVDRVVYMLIFKVVERTRVSYYTTNYWKKIVNWIYRVDIYIFSFYFFYDENFVGFTTKIRTTLILRERRLFWKNYIHLLKQYKSGKME